MSRRTCLLVAATLLVGATVIAIGPARAGGGGHCRLPEQTQSQDRVVEIKGSCFDATVTNVSPGETVTFENADPFAHNVIGWGGRWGTTDADLGTGDKLAVEFEKPGVYPFACYLHYGMTGAIVVGEGDGLAAGTTAGLEPAPPATERVVAKDAPASAPGARGSSPVEYAVLSVVALAAGALGVIELRRRRSRDIRPE